MTALLLAALLAGADPVIERGIPPQPPCLARPGGAAVRLEIVVDGKPVDEVWTKFLDDLFTWFDRDGDGFLSAAEVGRVITLPRPTGGVVPANFKKMDSDGDGRVSREEFRRYYQQTLGAPAVLRVVGPPGDLVAADAELVRRLDREGDGVLTRAKLARAPDLLGSLDEDEDGVLTLAEILAGRKPAKPGPAGLAPSAGATRPESLRIDLAADKGSRQEVGADRWSFAPHGTPGERVAATRRFCEAQFQTIAAGKDFVTREAVAEGDAGLLAVVFPAADRDGDGKLTAAELRDFLALVQRGVTCLAVIEVADRGRSLFDLLDRDGAGRLDVRALAAAPRAIPGERCPVAELPFSVRVTVTPGPAARSFGPVPLAEVKVPAGQPVPAAATVPEWFRAMDRNGDGVVTLAEFLGPRSLFQKLDRNGDGILTPDEVVPPMPK
jgi:Ca2+-binding EF-hand superfamily protein